jgi:hypothetical protein
LDIPSLVLRQEPEDALLIKQLNLIGANADPAANIPLPPEAYNEIATLPDVDALRVEYQLAIELVREKYSALQKAPESDP